MKKTTKSLSKAVAFAMALSMCLGGTAFASEEQPKLAEEQVLNLKLVDLSLLDVNDVRNANEF